MATNMKNDLFIYNGAKLLRAQADSTGVIDIEADFLTNISSVHFK